MCAFSTRIGADIVQEKTVPVGSKEYEVSYDTARTKFDEAYNSYQDLRGAVIKDNSQYISMGSARDSLVNAEATQMAKCTGESGFKGTEYLESEDLKAAVDSFFSNSYTNFNYFVGQGLGLVSLDITSIWEWRRSDNWWAEYSLFVCFAVMIVLLGIFIPLLAASSTCGTRAPPACFPASARAPAPCGTSSSARRPSGTSTCTPGQSLAPSSSSCSSPSCPSASSGMRRTTSMARTRLSSSR